MKRKLLIFLTIGILAILVAGFLFLQNNKDKHLDNTEQFTTIVKSDSEFPNNNTYINKEYLQSAQESVQAILAYHGLHYESNCSSNESTRLSIFKKWFGENPKYKDSFLIYDRFAYPCESAATVQMHMPTFLEIKVGVDTVIVRYEAVGWNSRESIVRFSKGEYTYKLHSDYVELVNKIVQDNNREFIQD